VPCFFDFNQNRDVSTNFVDIPNIKFQENLYDGILAVPFRQTTDGRTDGRTVMTKIILNNHLCFSNDPKMQ